LKREGSKLRTVDHRAALFNRLILPVLGSRPIEDIRRSEIVRLLDGIEDKNGQRMADVALAALRRIMAWHATRSDNFVPPIVRGMNRQNPVEHRRSRILNDDEIRRLWAATAGNQQPLHALIRVLLLTSARRGEAAGMRWEEVTDGVWLLPASRSKTKAAITRPLSQAAQALLVAQPRLTEFVFPGPSGPLQSFSKPKAKLDATAGIGGYAIHD